MYNYFFLLIFLYQLKKHKTTKISIIQINKVPFNVLLDISVSNSCTHNLVIEN